MTIVYRLLVLIAAVGAAAYLLPGIEIDDSSTTRMLEVLITFSIVLGLLNVFLKPVLKLLALPITILTLGLFALVVNVLVVYLAAAIVEGFAVHGFFQALLFSFIVSFITYVGSIFIDD